MPMTEFVNTPTENLSWISEIKTQDSDSAHLKFMFIMVNKYI